MNSIVHTSSVLILFERGNGELSEIDNEGSGLLADVPTKAQTG